MIRLRTLSAWRFRTRHDKGIDFLHSVERMQAILERERMRCDRGSSSFALLTLTFATRLGKAERLDIARTLQDRLRITDDAGLLGRRRIGIVLPETPTLGAWKVAEDVCDLLPAGKRRPECDVYAYPSDPDQTEIDSVRRVDEVEEGQREVRPMHALFVQPLPALKRAIDVVASGTALILAAPFLLLVALAVKVTSPGPIFYGQQRDGRGGRRFRIYKFRTMVVNAEAIQAELRAKSEQDGPAFKLKNDPRVTPIGRLLRRTCIDELPQLFNVLKGDMSIVGPRPMCSKEARHCSPWERRRLDVTPGLTCTWQVFGGTKVTFTEWMRMDLRYIRSRSLWTDLRLIVLTVPSVIRRDGVY
jgi:lipopolysaccharide/colanic/teichoic acid biosynthesis glycosyltransferase